MIGPRALTIISLLLYLIACSGNNSKSTRSRPYPTPALPSQAQTKQAGESKLPFNLQPSMRELDVGFAGDDATSEQIRLNLLPETALQVSFYRSEARQQEQILVNSIFLDIARDDYSLQKFDLMKDSREEVVIIGTPRSGEGQTAYVLALDYGGALRLALNLSTPAGGAINVDWDSQGFYLLSSHTQANGEEMVQSYRWSDQLQRFSSGQIQRVLPSSERDDRMRRIYGREKKFMLTSLNGLWLWNGNNSQEQVILNFTTEQRSMEVYIESKAGVQFLAQERALEHYDINESSFFYQGRISLDLSSPALGKERRWLSITYLSYDRISVASSVEEPWQGEYRRLNSNRSSANPIDPSQNGSPKELEGYFSNGLVSFDFTHGTLVLREEQVVYRGFYLFFLWQEIFILQYRAVNKEKQQERTGLYRVEIDSASPPTETHKQLVLIPLTHAQGTQPVLQLKQQPRPSEAASGER